MGKVDMNNYLKGKIFNDNEELIFDGEFVNGEK